MIFLFSTRMAPGHDNILYKLRLMQTQGTKANCGSLYSISSRNMSRLYCTNLLPELTLLTVLSVVLLLLSEIRLTTTLSLALHLL